MDLKQCGITSWRYFLIICMIFESYNSIRRRLSRSKLLQVGKMLKDSSKSEDSRRLRSSFPISSGINLLALSKLYRRRHVCLFWVNEISHVSNTMVYIGHRIHIFSLPSLSCKSSLIRLFIIFVPEKSPNKLIQVNDSLQKAIRASFGSF